MAIKQTSSFRAGCDARRGGMDASQNEDGVFERESYGMKVLWKRGLGMN